MAGRTTAKRRLGIPAPVAKFQQHTPPVLAPAPFWHPRPLTFTVPAFTVLVSAMLPFTALHRTVSANNSFILLLFIYWNFQVTDDQNRSRFFWAQMHADFFSRSFCFCLFYFCPLLLLPPLNHSKDTSKCNRTFNILLKATGQLKRTPDDQPTSRMPLLRE